MPLICLYNAKRTITFMLHDEKYWTDRYKAGETQWDAGEITTPLKAYFDQLVDKGLDILIPGCGNAYEAEYLHHKGFTNVYLVDISPVPLKNFSQRCPTFPKEHLLLADFFELDQSYDLIIEQTFFCSLHPSQRPLYASQCAQILKNGGKLVGVLFNDELFHDHPPYGGFMDDYLEVFEKHFAIKKCEPCYNSIQPRSGRELWIHFQK